MEFRIEKRKRNIDIHYPKEEFDIARDFAGRVYKEFGPFIKSLVLFGSVAKKEKLAKEADIDVLIVIDDVSINLTRDLVQTYRIIVEKVLSDMKDGERLHIQSMRLSSFWEYVRAGDPVAINILRYGMALIDTGIFDPLQSLLDNGRIRPTKESIYNYFTMAPASVGRSRDHILSAMVDLYWASVDAAHAALMCLGEIPPSPDHIADMLDEKMVRRGLLKGKYSKIMRDNYLVFKQIVHRQVKDVEGREYDVYRERTVAFVNEMRKFIEKRIFSQKF
ncbi:MAG: nucleotidyltransferase domain-containing protein [archaeon]